MVTPATITTNTFEHDVLHAPGPVLIDFWAPWCGPCRLVGPVVEEIATQYAGRLTVGKLNVDEHPAVAQRSGITSIPALVFFHEGQVATALVPAGVTPTVSLPRCRMPTATSTRRIRWAAAIGGLATFGPRRSPAVSWFTASPESGGQSDE